AERGVVPEALLGAIAAALRFNDPADVEVTELAAILASAGAADATARITGLEPGHPLFNAVSTLVEERQAEVARTPV
ncbi:MAG TPA: mannitol-1-phosphate 5-dehydrogenase, partial [Arthrobacter sp.]